MAKKSLTDLLREEVKKTPEVEGEKFQKVTAVEKSQMNTPNPPRTTNSSLTKAELQAKVAELKTSLEKAKKTAQDKEEILIELKNALTESHEKESSLQEQITELQSELQEQKKSVEKLQNTQEKLEQLKTEFEQAKTAALRLAEVNEKLTKEIDTMKKENEGLNAQAHKEPDRTPGRPLQKERDKSEDFAKKAWLL